MTDRSLLCLETAADSHRGEVRANNEDRYSVTHPACDGLSSTLAMVADGVGGHAAGEVASQTVIETMQSYLGAGRCQNPAGALCAAAVIAGREVRRRAQGNTAWRGMGSTLVAAWVIRNRLYTVTVGDSRIYLRRGGVCFQASIDHTWVQEAVDQGFLAPDQAKYHPNAHVLRRHLGGEKDAEPDQRLRLSPKEGTREAQVQNGLVLEPGDGVVLCSDGLSDLVEPAEIGKALESADLEKGVQALISLARSRGGHDNITVVAIRVPPAAQARPAELKQPVTRMLDTVLVGLVVIAAVVLLLILFVK